MFELSFKAVALAACLATGWALPAGAAPADVPLPPAATIEVQPLVSSALATATKALNALQKGAATGAWDDFLALLADDVSFYAPAPGFAGLARGKPNAEALFAAYAKTLRVGLTLGRTLANGPEITFELRAEGNLEGFASEYANNFAITLVIDEGRIVQFRWYEAAPAGWAGAATGRGAFKAADETMGR